MMAVIQKCRDCGTEWATNDFEIGEIRCDPCIIKKQQAEIERLEKATVNMASKIERLQRCNELWKEDVDELRGLLRKIKDLANKADPISPTTFAIAQIAEEGLDENSKA